MYPITTCILPIWSIYWRWKQLYFPFPVINFILLNWHHGPVGGFFGNDKEHQPPPPPPPPPLPLSPNYTLSRQANWSPTHSQMIEYFQWQKIFGVSHKKPVGKIQYLLKTSGRERQGEMSKLSFIFNDFHDYFSVRKAPVDFRSEFD